MKWWGNATLLVDQGGMGTLHPLIEKMLLMNDVAREVQASH